MSAKETGNPRNKNGNLRRKHKARLRAIGGPCGICKGRFGPIHYDEPSDSQHPYSFVVDEIRPISLYKAFGYSSKREAAEDWDNLQAAHYYCNSLKSNKLNFSLELSAEKETSSRSLVNIKDGAW